MKKTVSLFIILSMLFTAFTLSVFAATDIEFSVSSVKGKPGDTVDVDVTLDKNPGTWSAYFNIVYDNRCFELLKVKNGSIFTDSEFEKGTIDKSGKYLYWAMKDEDDQNAMGTGVIVTLSFKILDTAPSGDQSINLEFPDNGVGYFFDCKDTANDLTVSAKNAGKITITGSDAAPLPEITAAPETDTGASSSDASKPDASKEPVTQKVIEVVTDADGEIVTDAEGKPETVEVVKVIGGDAAESTDAASSTNSPDSGNDKNEAGKEGNDVGTIILIISICAIIVAAIIVIIVMSSSKKKAPAVEPEKKDNENNNASADNNTDNDNNDDTENKE